jgi:CheY-like chemotaxis protein
VTADPTRFRQILFNLLSNAVKFTPEGGRITVIARRVHGSECRVQGGTSAHEPSTMNYERIEDWVEIAVEDTGIGIKAEDMPKLFQEFTQLDSSLAKRHQGTGLGLALTKRLVELHGGQIRAESPGEGQGSTFIVTLPFHAPRSPRPRLLLVDDDMDFGEALAAVLERAGYAVEVVGDGREALAKLAQSLPDILLLDMVLPGCDGRDVLASLREREGTRRLPVIAITGVLADLEEEIRTLGADEFLTKPFAVPTLLEVLARYLGARTAIAPTD